MLHRSWCAAGYAPDTFWQQTPATFHSAMAGAEERARIDGRRDVALAHTVASFTRAKKLQALQHYLPAAVARAAGSLLDRLKSIAERTKDL